MVATLPSVERISPTPHSGLEGWVTLRFMIVPKKNCRCSNKSSWIEFSQEYGSGTCAAHNHQQEEYMLRFSGISKFVLIAAAVVSCCLILQGAAPTGWFLAGSSPA